jgi:hypothetical protein
MKALEKNRNRRYETASGLARDLERHLAGESVEARPPSRTYRLRRFGYRHRAAFLTAAASGGFFVLVISLVMMMAVNAERARRQAMIAAEREHLARSAMLAAQAQAARAEAERAKKAGPP